LFYSEVGIYYFKMLPLATIIFYNRNGLINIYKFRTKYGTFIENIRRHGGSSPFMAPKEISKYVLLILYVNNFEAVYSLH